MKLCNLQYLSILAFAFSSAEEPGYVEIPLQIVHNSPQLSKRQVSNGTFMLNSQQSSYLATISLGTPGQQLQLVLDTGSPLTWVNAANVSTFTPGSSSISSSDMSAGTIICRENTCFMASTSSSLTVPADSTVFDITYVDGTESIGRTAVDALSFQGLQDTTFTFGLVEYFYSPGDVSSAIGGILGLSPDNPVLSFDTIPDALSAGTLTSASAVQSFSPPTILDQLMNAGKIRSLAFSLYLDDTTSGQLTLGGVDTGRYTGPLTVLPIENDPNYQGTSYSVNLRAVGLGGSSSNQNTVNNLFTLDSGTTSMYLPASVVQSLADDLNGYFIPYSQSSGILGVPCSVSTTIDFYFENDAVIKVPTSVLQEGRISSAQARRYGISATSDICILNLFGTADDSTYLLGAAFLRSCYVVYNIEQNQIAVAQAFYDGNSNILPITSGEFGIPNAIYNSSSPSPSNSVVIPSITRSVALATAGGIRTSVGNGGTLTFSAPTGTATRTNSAAHRPNAFSGFSLIFTLPFGLIVGGMLFF